MIAVLLARVHAALAAYFQVPDCCPHPDCAPEEVA